ncbi:PrgI family protein [Fusibacter bizertensis]
MAFVSVPKDLNKVKTKVALNLTLRQLISFSIAAAIGFPVYWFSRKAIGNDLAVFLMIGCVLPFFFVAIFEKDGIVFEKYMGYIIKQKFVNPKVRHYKSQNFYAYLNNTEESEVQEHEKQTSRKTRTATFKKSKGIKK